MLSASCLCTTVDRMDILVLTSDYIYILELKIDQSAADALRQIDEKRYALPFASDPRRLFKIGVSFSSPTRPMEEWKVATNSR